MTVLIIGGGASGMAAALTAARAGHQVVLAERQARVGRKLLATGNGRCNLTNENARPDRYHGEGSRISAGLPWRSRSFRRRERWPFSGAWAWSPSRSPAAGCTL